MVKNFLKNRIILLSFVLVVSSSTHVFAQLNLKSKLGASVSKSVEVSFEIPFLVRSNSSVQEEIYIKPSDSYEDNKRQPAMMMISGLISEVMINMEADTVFLKNEDGVNIEVSRFDIVEQGAGSNVMVMPSVNQSSFVVPVGGVLQGDLLDGQFYQGTAVVYVNFI